MNELNSNWVEVCPETEIEMEDLKRFDHGNKTFCIYKLEDGFYAIVYPSSLYCFI